MYFPGLAGTSAFQNAHWTMLKLWPELKLSFGTTNEIVCPDTELTWFWAGYMLLIMTSWRTSNTGINANTDFLFVFIHGGKLTNSVSRVVIFIHIEHHPSVKLWIVIVELLFYRDGHLQKRRIIITIGWGAGSPWNLRRTNFSEIKTKFSEIQINLAMCSLRKVH